MFNLDQTLLLIFEPYDTKVRFYSLLFLTLLFLATSQALSNHSINDLAYSQTAPAEDEEEDRDDTRNESSEGDEDANSATDSADISKATDSENDATDGKKFVILTFNGGDRSQYVNAKSILDKYGFKTTFYVVCNYAQKAGIENTSNRMNWNEIINLNKQGHDIGAKSNTDVGFDQVSAGRSQYLISESKHCLHERGIDAKSFVYPFNKGTNLDYVTRSVAKHFDLALSTKASTRAPLMFLDCRIESIDKANGDNNNGDSNSNSDNTESPGNKIGCREYLANGTLSSVNRYSIKAWSHDAERKKNSLDDTQMLETFIQVANSQDEFNEENKTAAIPIIMWHKIQDTPDPYHTSLALFEAEMKYLHDNGFTVLTMADLEFDKNTNALRVNSQ
jgi:hypothetical protein